MTVVAASDLTVIRVDGRLAGAGLGELERECRAARRPVVLDLTQLTGMDEGGRRLLKELAGDGVHLVGVTPYFAMLLEERPARSDPRRPSSARSRPSGGPGERAPRPEGSRRDATEGRRAQKP